MTKKSKKLGPRKTPDREDWYMGLAFWSAAKSKDPQTQIGAVAVSEDNAIVGTGYNGPPPQYNDHSDINWRRPDKYGDIVHAEINAILHTVNFDRIKGATIYVTAIPCGPCMLLLAHCRVKKVVYYAYVELLS